MEEGKLSRSLFWRGTHRMLGNPTLGTFTVFLTGLFLIRVAANIYLSIYLTKEGSTVDAIQITSAHFILLSAYIIWVGSLATFRLSFALPRLCFVNFAPYERRFRSGFLRHIAVLRPMNLASLLIIILIAFAFSMVFGMWHAIMTRAFVVLFFTFLGIVLVITVTSWVSPGRSEIQIIEMLYMMFLVTLNPDTGSFNKHVSIFFRGIYSPVQSVWEVVAAVGLIVLFAVLILLLVKILSAVDNLFRRQLSFNMLERWYWRFFRVRFWGLLYIIITPILMSPFILISTKRLVLILFIFIGVLSYLFFIAHSENTLREKWRSSLFDKGNIRLILRSVLIHIGLTLIPVFGYIIVK